jgi:uncharacterized protein YjbI with pentapeptide repeats
VASLFLECLTLVTVFGVLFTVSLVSIYRFPDLWPLGFQILARRLETAAQYRLRRLRVWFSMPGSLLTLTLIAGGLVALIVGIAGHKAPAGTLFNTISDEIIGLSMAILLLDLIYRLRFELQDKRQIVRQMRSRSNPHALDAVQTAIGKGWHRDGSLKGAVLEHANLWGATMTHANLQETFLLDAVLCHANLVFADLRHAHLSRADLSGADLSYSDLRDAGLELVNFENASLGRSCLRGAQLEGANLRSAFLAHADLEGAVLRQALYDNKTIWPNPFAPPADAINWDTLNEVERNLLREWRWYLQRRE